MMSKDGAQKEAHTARFHPLEHQNRKPLIWREEGEKRTKAGEQDLLGGEDPRKSKA